MSEGAVPLPELTVQQRQRYQHVSNAGPRGCQVSIREGRLGEGLRGCGGRAGAGLHGESPHGPQTARARALTRAQCCLQGPSVARGCPAGGLLGVETAHRAALGQGAEGA